MIRLQRCHQVYIVARAAPIPDFTNTLEYQVLQQTVRASTSTYTDSPMNYFTASDFVISYNNYYHARIS